MEQTGSVKLEETINEAKENASQAKAAIEPASHQNKPMTRE